MRQAHSPPGACYSRVLIQGNVSDERGERTTLACRVVIPDAQLQ